MKRFINLLPLIAGAIALSACSENISAIEEETYDGAQLMTITASQEGDDTRAAIDATVSSMIDWSKNDKINYYGAGKDEFMTLDGDGGSSSGSFSGTVTPNSNGNNYVLYPYNATATCDRSLGYIATTVPSVQHVPAGSFDPKCAIMVGKVNGTSVQFMNAVGFLAITISTPNITKMVITGNDNEYLWGDISIQGITANAAPTTITWKSNGNKYKYIEVLPEGTTSFETGKTYYVAVSPNATLSKGMYILFYNGSTNDPKNLKLAAKKTTKDVGMARNKVKKVQLPTIDQNSFLQTIELVAENGNDKLYMSPLNLGAETSVEEYLDLDQVKYADHIHFYMYEYYKKTFGNFYAWGEIDTKSEYTADNYTISSYSSFKDAATANWGPDWRMPTNAELNKNLSVSHIKILPAAGFYDGTVRRYGAPTAYGDDLTGSFGYYWTSDRGYLVTCAAVSSSGEYSGILAFNSSLSNTGFKGYEGMTITPVLK